MASDETASAVALSSAMHEEESDGADDPYADHDHHHLHARGSMSRLSVCSRSFLGADDDEDDVDGDHYYRDEVEARGMATYMSRLSMESFDADEEFSDEKELLMIGGMPELLSDSDDEPECYSLPATPPRRRTRCAVGVGGGGSARRSSVGLKEYASESEGQKCVKSRRSAKRRVIRERCADANGGDTEKSRGSYRCNSLSGESEGGGGGGGWMVITRPKGGIRSLRMDLEEVKACRDLGFELEHERMVEMPNRVSISGSTTLDTSSGGNSPIANWRISSPGDDPRDVKARLKMWAQAVALASASFHGI